MVKIITISREFGSGGRTIDRRFLGIEKAVAVVCRGGRRCNRYE